MPGSGLEWGLPAGQVGPEVPEGSWGVGQEGQHWAAASSSLTSFWFPVTSQISPIYLSSHRDLKLVLPALERAEGRAA